MATASIIFSFVLHATTVSLKEPVVVDFTIRNSLADNISFDLGHNRKSSFKFVVTNPKGKVEVTQKEISEGIGLVGWITLKPEEQYTQKLLVNEWYSFTEIGDYIINISLLGKITSQSGLIIEQDISESLPISICPMDPDNLKQICQNLTEKALALTDYQVAAEAANTLSYIHDPVAIPYMEKILQTNSSHWQFLIPGLSRIANKEAIRLLISIIYEHTRS